MCGALLDLIRIEIARILLILLTSGSLASITFLSKGKVKVITAEADPVTLSGHGGEDKAIISVFGRRSVGSHFEF